MSYFFKCGQNAVNASTAHFETLACNEASDPNGSFRATSCVSSFSSRTEHTCSSPCGHVVALLEQFLAQMPWSRVSLWWLQREEGMSSRIFFKQSNPPVYRHKTTSLKFGLLCEALGAFQRWPRTSVLCFCFGVVNLVILFTRMKCVPRRMLKIQGQQTEWI